MTKNIERQPIWESSRRPLYPKCEWVEGAGHRRFVLDHDINKRRKVYKNRRNDFSDIMCNLSEEKCVKKSNSCDGILVNKMEQLKLVGSSETVRRGSNQSDDVNKNSTVAAKTCRRYERSTGKNNLSLLKKQMKDKFSGRKRMQSVAEAAVAVTQRTKSDTNSADGQMSEQYREPTDHSNINRNELAERVLQWLDLAGRRTLLKHTESGETKNKPQRRIHTTESIKKPKVLNQQPLLKRTESLHHLSLIFDENNLEYSDMQTHRNDQDKNGNSAFGEFFPNTYRCSRQFLSKRNSSHHIHHHHHHLLQKQLSRELISPTGDAESTISQHSTNSAHSKCDPQRSIENNKLNKSVKSPTTTAPAATTTTTSIKNDKIIENQYRTIIQRQILEKSCNTQLAKRQLHIFMPNLPKKCLLPSTNNANASNVDECDSSCLSTHVECESIV